MKYDNTVFDLFSQLNKDKDSRENDRIFNEIKLYCARQINDAGLLAYSLLDTPDFIPAFTQLHEVFKSEYANYLFASHKLNPYIVDTENSHPVIWEKISTCYETVSSLMKRDDIGIMDPRFVRNFDPEKAADNEHPFFSYVNGTLYKTGNSNFKKELIDTYRTVDVSLSSEQVKLLSAALRYLESAEGPAEDHFENIAIRENSTVEKVAEVWYLNQNSRAVDIDRGVSSSDGGEASLHETIASKDLLDKSEIEAQKEVIRRLKMLDVLFALENVTKSEAPYKLSKTEKQRYPLLFTNMLILGWIDELRDSDPECSNRRDVLEKRFDDLALAARKEYFSRFKVVCPEIFDLYIENRKEVTIGELADMLGVDRSSFSDIARSMEKKLPLFFKQFNS